MMSESRHSSLPLHVSMLISLVLAPVPSVSQEQLSDLGRLFTDPAQRERLEAVRHGAYVVEKETKDEVTTVTVNGVMMRGDGETVIWVNGKSTLEKDPLKGVKVLAGSANRENFKVPVMVDGKFLTIKPGQVWSDGSGDIKDNY